jgi:GTPase SAR1 family protein
LEVQVEKPPDNPANLSYFTIIVLGANGVGKTSITQQFMTSEYVAFDNSIGSLFNYCTSRIVFLNRLIYMCLRYITFHTFQLFLHYTNMCVHVIKNIALLM